MIIFSFNRSLTRLLSFFEKNRIFFAWIWILIGCSFSGIAQKPGGVGTGLKLWLDTSNGVTASGNNLTAWSDRAGVNTFTVSATRPTVNNNAINFNPTVAFNNTTANTSYPATQNLIGNTSITAKDGYAVFKIDTNNGGTVIGGTLPGANYGTAFFGQEFSYMKVGNGASYSSFPMSDYANYHLYNMDVSGSPVTGTFDGANQAVSIKGTSFSGYSFIPAVGTTNNKNNSDGWYHLRGQIAEVILYDQTTASRRINIESYLSLKYGIHKAGNYVDSNNNILWNATTNAAYHNDVFGIGMDNLSGLNQPKSNSMNTGSGDGTGQSAKGNIVISNPSSLANNGFLIIGHDTGALTELTETFGTNNSSARRRIQRTWKVQSTGNPGTVTLSYDITGLTYSAKSSSDYVLLVDPTGAGSFTGTGIVSYSPTLTGNILSFANVDLPTGAVFTFQTLLAPTVQATNVTFTNTKATTTTVGWTNGNGSSRAVFMFAGSSGSPVPVNGTTYTANTVFGTGTQIGTGGWYCIYNGTGSTVDVTGLAPQATYQVMVLEYNDNGSSGNQLYLSTTATGNPAGVTTPYAQKPGGVGTGLKLWLDTSNGVTASGNNLTAWSDRAGVNTFTVSATQPTVNNNAINFHPTVGFNNNDGMGVYPATQNLIGNTAITARDGYGVFKMGTGTIIGSALSGTSYGGAFFGAESPRIYVSRGVGSTHSGFLMATDSNYHMYNMDISGSTVTGKFDGTGQTVTTVGTTFQSYTFTPTVGTTNNKNGNAPLNGWDHLKGEIAEVILYDQTTASQRINIESYLSLKYGIHKAGNYVDSNNNILWNATTNAAYHNDVFGIGMDNLSGLNQPKSNSMNTGSGDGTGQSAKGNIVISNPSSLANNGFLIIGHDTGALTELTETFGTNNSSARRRIQRTWKVQSTGNPGTVTLSYDITGLTYSAKSSSDYVLLVDPTGAGSFTGTGIVSYSPTLTGNILSFANVDLPTGAVFTFQTLIAPTVQATKVTFTNTKATTTTVGWTNGNGSSRAVFMFAGSSGSPVPVNGTTYTANTVFGTGTQIGTGGWYCIYNGTGSTVDVTGLNPKTTYQVMVLEYNGSSDNQLYLSTTDTGNPAGVTTLNNVATLTNLSINKGTLSPDFASGTISYNAKVDYATKSITLTPTVTDSNATVKINGVTVTSGSASGAIDLKVGSNDITTVVTAEDGTTTKTYTTTIDRTAQSTISTSGTLAALTTTYGTPSASTTFSVSGTNMLEGILITSPSGFEVSSDGTTFTNSITVGAAGTITSKSVYIRLKGTISIGNYSGDIVLTSNTAENVNVATASSTVNKAALTITAVDKSKTYGSANPTLTASYSGFVNGDSESILTTAPNISTTAQTGSAVGSYDITADGAAASNYSISYTKGSLTVNKAVLTITAVDKSKTCGSANPVLTAAYSGFVNGEDQSSLTTAPNLTTTAVTESPVGTYTITAGGAVASNYTISYADGTLTIIGTIKSTDDLGAPVNGYEGGIVVNVLDNDLLNCAAAAAGKVKIALASTLPSGINFDTATGKVSVNPHTPSGTYTFDYTICDLLNILNCSTSTVTIEVEASKIETSTQTPPFTIVATGGTTPSVVSDVKINGQPVVIGTKPGEVTLTGTKVPPGFTLNPDGTVTVPPNTPGGSYKVEYQICEVSNPTNCSTSTVTIEVEASKIETSTQTPPFTIGATGGTTPSVVSDVKINGQPVVIGTKPGEVTLTGTKVPPGFTLNPDGTVTVPPNTPGGSYKVEYQICEVSNPTNCSTSTVTIEVEASKIESPTQTPPFTIGATGGTTPSAVSDVKINGQPVVIGTKPGEVTLTGTKVPPGFTLNPDGTVTVPPNTPGGSYKVEYQICEVSNPTNCSTSTVTIEVEASKIESPTQTPFFSIGATGGTTPSVVSDVKINGKPVVIGTKPGEVILTGTKVPSGFTLNPDGTVTVPPNTPGGSYTVEYQVCEVTNPTNCSTGTVKIEVEEPTKDCVIKVFNAFSPNGDSQNDRFYIQGLECYPDNKVEIYNRWGRLIFECEHYNNEDRVFKGGNGELTGTYYYVLKYSDNKSQTHEKASYLYISK
ncbi:MBG domain-containing protein [Flavobacterium sp. N502540]|uniref:MBG domain-containing protein n=1 Tax=Flavobacterium sp. N502540 TaxID=2986838 RepID=UPI002223FE8D|nr:MBG domain-containing protein [Flavobacterium sp. N502540]